MFDYKILDDYKIAIDNDFVHDKTKFNGDTYICKTRGGYYVFIFTHPTGEEVEIIQKDWVSFKKKVVEFFEGGIQDV